MIVHVSHNFYVEIVKNRVFLVHPQKMSQKALSFQLDHNTNLQPIHSE